MYRYVVDMTNQGIYMQKFFDNFNKDTDNVSIEIVDGDIYMFRSSKSATAGTDVFVYSNFYKGWHRWSTKLHVRGRKYDAYFGKNVYNFSGTSQKDDGENEFSQSLQLVTGEDNVFSLKKQFFTKLYLGNKSTD